MDPRVATVASSAEVRWRGSDGSPKSEAVQLIGFDDTSMKFSVTSEGRRLLSEYDDRPCGFTVW